MTAPAGQRVDVATLAGHVFTAVTDHFSKAGVKLPDRQVMAAGAPEQIAWDCDQLVMTLSGIGLGAAPGQAASNRTPSHFQVSVLRHVVFTFQLVRCEPKPTNNGRVPPTLTAMQQAALTHWRDAGLISHALTRAVTDIESVVGPGALVQAGAVAPVGPEGGYVGLQTSVTITAPNLA